MKSSHLLAQPLPWSIAIALSFATICLSSPVRADQTVSNENVQTTTVTGSNNTVNQRSNTTVRGGTRGGDNKGTSVRNRQNADVAGDGNTVNQSSQAEIENRQRRNR
jgi:hypothetical protein